MSQSANKQFNEDIIYRVARIEHLAKKHGWKLKKKDEASLEFKSENPEVEMYVDYVHLTIRTKLIHPKKGKSLLERTGELTQKLIEKIFRNPRAHMPNSIKSTHLQC